MPPHLHQNDLHRKLPTECVFPNVSAAHWDQLEYPGIFGTGFIAKRGRTVYYFTALHCVISSSQNKELTFPTLLLPHRLTGLTTGAEDFVQIESARTMPDPLDKSEWVDLVAFSIGEGNKPADYEKLLQRAAILPAFGEWLDTFTSSAEGQGQLASGDLLAYVIGCPRDSDKTSVSYGEFGSETVISSEVVQLIGKVTQGNLFGHFTFTPDQCPHSLSGFSGSPVFASISNNQSPKFALLGMVDCGSKTSLNFLPIGRLVELIFAET